MLVATNIPVEQRSFTPYSNYHFVVGALGQGVADMLRYFGEDRREEFIREACRDISRIKNQPRSRRIVVDKYDVVVAVTPA